MKKIILIVCLLSEAAIATAQVGIGTATPKATLDIPATNPATPTNTDGILVPRINAFPATNPAIDQNGMMVFLTADLPGKTKGFYYWDNATASWIGVGADAKGWELTGNAGTNPAVNFLGTMDNVPLIFKVGGEKAGRIGITDEVFLGYKAGNVNSGGTNTGIGFQSMLNNASGNQNTAIGYRSLYQNVGGYWNTALGMHTLYYNDEGGMNTASGVASMLQNKTGSQNSAYGVETLWSNVSGYGNVANGRNAMRYNIDGDQNVAYGRESLFYNVNSDGNTAIGNDALHANIGEYNTAIGYQSGNLNDTGGHNITVGDNANVPVATSSNQLSIGNVIYGTTMSTTALGKIGIGEPAPSAKFQISSASPASPANTDGIIIPRVSALTAAGSMTVAQNGMTVFLTALYSGKQPGFYYWDHLTASWKGVQTEKSWSLGGNAGTDDTVNFIGTTDNSDVVFKFWSDESGRLNQFNTSLGWNAFSPTSFGSGNTAIGTFTLHANTTGIDNTAIGMNVLNNNTTGSYNAGLGRESLSANIGGSSNTAFGRSTLASNTNASKNVALGERALYLQSFANSGAAFDSNNVAVGYEALNANNPTSTLSGINNTAIGNYALKSNTVGYWNTAVGTNALSGNSTGMSNTAMGYESMLGSATPANNTGYGNVGLGNRALRNNTSGNLNVAIGSNALSQNEAGNNNLVIGEEAMQRPTKSSNATALGTFAMYFYGNGLTTAFTNTNTVVGFQAMLSEHFGSLPGSNNIGLNNTVIGYNSLQGNSTGSNNTLSGYQSMFTNKTGNSNVAIGQETLYSNVSGSNNIAIGYEAGYNETGSNKLYIENSSSSTPLIYGEFDNDLVRVYGKTESIYTQLTANGDGQSNIYGYRNRDSQNNGTGYSMAGTNKAVTGYNHWGDIYTFGTVGFNDNDSNRTGGVLGANTNGAYWSSLGYKASNNVTYGAYASAVLGSGTGRMDSGNSQAHTGIGGGFYGGLIGSWSKGNLIGNINSGSLFASYNSGDEYTAGKQIEIVATGNTKTAAYTVTSTESIVYKKGKTTLQNGSARVDFKINYTSLLGDVPVVTVSAMGQCNGLYIESVDKTGFTVRELNNGTSNVSVSWIAVGDRVDANSEQPVADVLDAKFDENINQVMFNENNKDENAKAMWSAGNTIQFGQLPASEIKANKDLHTGQ